MLTAESTRQDVLLPRKNAAHDATDAAGCGQRTEQHTYEQVEIVKQKGEKATEQDEQLDALIKVHGRSGWRNAAPPARLCAH